MTWYAHHIFASPAALAPLAAELPGHVYHVRDLAEYRRTRSEVYAVTIPAPGGTPETHYRNVEEGPRLPSDGLVVVRELCEPETHAAEWFGEDGIGWEGHGKDAPGLLPALEGDDVCVSPPRELLAMLRTVSRDTRSVVSLCCIATWGGDLEYATSWVFDGAWNVDFIHHRPGDQSSHHVKVWSSSSPGAPRIVADGNVLTLTLVHHGLLLSDGYFQLHTRDFPWDRHRVG